MSRVGIDLDGVCYDFCGSLREFLHQSGARHRFECPEPTRWEFYRDWGMTTSEFLTWCHRGVEAGVIFSWGDPFDGVPEAFDRIRSAGHTIHIVTDRSFGKAGASEAATRAWLDKHGLEFDSLTFTTDKTVVRLDTMVDDKVENYRALRAAGVKTWMHSTTANQGTLSVDRVDSLTEYAELVA